MKRPHPFASGDSGTSAGPAHSRRPAVTLYCACAALFVLLVALSLFMVGPMIHGDEGSYLLNAATIAGRLAANPPNDYYSGYSLLLVPGFLFDAGAGPVYHFALVVNALLVASIPLALHRFMRQLWPDPGNDAAHVAAALAATCYVPLLMLSQLAMSESALACSYAWMLAYTTAALRTTRITAALLAGALAGFLFLVHARGAMMAAPVLLVATAYCVVHRRSRRALAALWLAALGVALLHGVVESAAGLGRASSAGMLRDMLEHLAMPANWKWPPLNFIGASTEAIVTSLGVAVVAARSIAAELRDAWRHRQGLSLRVTMLAASALAMLASLGVTAAFFVPPQRADQLAHGRYALPTLIPLLAVGLFRLLGQRDVRQRDFLWSLGVGLAGIAITSFAYGGLSPTAQANWNFVNSIDLRLFNHVMPGIHPWLSIALCFVVLAGLLGAAFRFSGIAGTAWFGLLNLGLFALAWITISLPSSRYFADHRAIVDAVHAFAVSGGRKICLTLVPEVDAWHRTDLTWQLFPHMAKAQADDCIEGAISPLDHAMEPGMRLAAFEPPSPGSQAPIGLYLRSGIDFDDFARVVATPPEDFLRPTAIDDRHADIGIVDALPLRTRTGSAMDIHVRITNRGSRVLPTVRNGEYLPHPILLDAQVEAGGRHLEYRSILPEAVAPGGSIDMVMRIGPFPEPGRYDLRIGVAQEHVATYAGATETTIEVDPANP